MKPFAVPPGVPAALRAVPLALGILAAGAVFSCAGGPGAGDAPIARLPAQAPAAEASGGGNPTAAPEASGPPGPALADLPPELPAPPPEEGDLPSPELDLVESAYPASAPPEEIPGLVPEPEPPPPLVQTPPVPAPPPVPPAPPPPPAAPPAPGPTPPRPGRQTPPPAPPVAVRPSLPPPPPEPPREPPFTPVIPDMPFQPVSPLPSMPAEEDLAYSRTVKALAGQYVEIPFRGPGWVYLGEFGSRRGVSYDARRMEEDGMTFIFRADQEGSYSLKFNRQDFIRDSVLNDYVKVIVESPPQSTGAAWSRSQAVPDRVYAGPRWPPSTGPGGVPGDPVTAQAGPLEEENAPEASAAFSGPPPAAGAAAAESAAGSAVPAAGDAPAPPPSGPVERGETAAASGGSPAGATVSPGDLLRRAKADYDGGRVAAALSALDQYLLSNPAGGDEAYWLYGQALEANNPATRDIRRALEYYRRLMREYPQSGRYEDARRRAAYLERYYFNIQ